MKPSEKDPGLALELAALLAEAGLPAGVFNVVNGDREAVDALLEHPGVAAVSFVGSTPVAEHVFRTAANAGKRVQALGGAKNHMVVMPDADIAQAADALMGAAYGGPANAAWRSRSPSPSATRPTRWSRGGARIATLRVGRAPSRRRDGAARDPEHPRVLAYIDGGVAEGAELVVDGRECTRAAGKGYFLGATCSITSRREMRIYSEEIFGPVLSLVRVATSRRRSRW